MKSIIITGLYIFVLSVIFLPGCGQGSSITMPDSSDSPGSTSPDTQSTAPSNAGWTYFKNGLFSDASTEFSKIISNPSVSEKDKALAYTGLGWAQIKSTGFYKDGIFNTELITYFDNADTYYNDAKVGLAVAYLTRNSAVVDSQNAVTLLKSSLDANGNFKSENNIDLTNADVHLLLSMALFESGDTPEAEIELNTANSLGASSSSTIFDSISDTLMALIN